ncbi:MAG: Fe-S cluster domain-containing protein [Marinifilum sp.]|jgi:Na+-translocating ferredoxin:NAD+ oxidoreductase RNF subunit RnfB|nr:Fe-S cluster domain-containing protein [Marinifilum sp.]
MSIIAITILALCAIGVTAAIILFFVAQKFKVYEDPRIDEVEEALPAANCGGCGYPGCRGFAEALVKADDISNFNCPVGGAAVMSHVGALLGHEVKVADPTVAVVRCNGTCENRPKTNQYDGASSCSIAASLYSGETGCQYGCLGLGECVEACNFDAMYMDKETGLPVIIEDKCVSCGACVTACPNNIIELRKKGPKSRRIFVSCVNKDKGAVAKKACNVACIGCRKCEKECPFDAIVVENNLAYIDYDKCKLCRKCVVVCPTNAIHELNFPPRKEKPAVKADAKTVKPVAKVKAEVKDAPKAEPKANDSKEETSDNK